MKQPTIITADDLTTGMFVSIHQGREQLCPCGCGSGGEMYGKFKGLPLAVNGISLPYVACSVVPVGMMVVVDIRECELCRLDESYVKAFQPGTQVAE